MQPTWLGLHLQVASPSHIWRSWAVQEPHCLCGIRQGCGCRASTLQCFEWLLPFVISMSEEGVWLSWVKVMFLYGSKKGLKEWCYISLKLCWVMGLSFCLHSRKSLPTAKKPKLEWKFPKLWKCAKLVFYSLLLYHRLKSHGSGHSGASFVTWRAEWLWYVNR